MTARPQTSSRPAKVEVGLTRTRCVPTRLFAGHADNALPQLATAMVNCRIFPGDDPNAIKAELEKLVADPTVVVTRNDDYVASLASPLRPDVTAAYTKAVQTLHPGMPVFPEMSTGASDARPFRVAGIPVYGTNGAWVQVPTDFRAHGKDERIPVQSLYDNVVHWQLMLTRPRGQIGGIEMKHALAFVLSAALATSAFAAIDPRTIPTQLPPGVAGEDRASLQAGDRDSERSQPRRGTTSRQVARGPIPRSRHSRCRHSLHALRGASRRSNRSADRPLALAASDEEADADPRPHGRGRGQARRLEVRSVRLP